MDIPSLILSSSVAGSARGQNEVNPGCVLIGYPSGGDGPMFSARDCLFVSVKAKFFGVTLY